MRLWALDVTPPQLIPFTRATGPTPRIAGLTKLAGQDGLGEADWIVVTDDDVTLPPRGLATFVGLSARAELSLAQPAQDAGGFPSHPFTLRRPLSLVRETGFVEGGPVICVRSAWWDTLMPQSDEMGMGWGIEILWAAQRRSGARLGVVDGVVMRHLAPPGQRYDQGPEKQRMQRLLDEHGVPSLAALHTTVRTWRPWRRHPPWIASPR